MNKHGQRRKKESLHCKSDFSGAKLHFFVHYSTNIQRQLWISTTPKVQKSGLWHQENHTQHHTPQSARRLHQSYFPLVRAPGNKVHGLEKQEGKQRGVLKDVPQLRIRKKCVTTQKIRMKTPEQANNSGFMGYSTLIYPHIQY